MLTLDNMTTQTGHESLIFALAIKVAGDDVDILKIGKLPQDTGGDRMTDNGFWLWDYEHDIMYYSTEFKKTLGYTEEDIIENNSKFFKEHMLQEDLATAYARTNIAFKNKDTSTFYNVVNYRTKDNVYIQLKCSVNIMFAKGKPIILFGSHLLV